MKTIIWKGIYYNSLEYFEMSETNDNIFVQSKIIGTASDKNYLVEYEIYLDKKWRIFNFKIDFKVDKTTRNIKGIRNNEKWEIDGKTMPQFEKFNFIDISLSPFTNTLPVKNLNLLDNEEKEINVIYIDILNGEIGPAKQKYRRNAIKNYRYENISNDFKADIDVDEFGLVTYYQSLFQQIAKF